MTPRRHRTPARRGAARSAGALLLVAVLTACSSGSGVSPRASPGPESAGGARASQTQAAELEAALTAVLVERVYARVVAAQVPSSGARAALDATSVELTEVLGTPTEERGPLLAALRDCDALQLAASQPDGAAVGEAGSEAVRSCGLRLAAVVQRVTPPVPAAQLAGRLVPVPAAADDDLLRSARDDAATARGTARLLAEAAAASRDLEPPGSRASALRADLTWLLVEHVALAASPGPAASAGPALAANGADLVALLARTHVRLREPFRSAWNAHLDRLSALRKAQAAGDVARSLTLRTAVTGFGDELGPLLARSVPGLPPERLAQELNPSLDALVAAVVAVEAGADDAAAARAHAVSAVLAPAALVAAAIAEDRRLD